MRAARRRAAVAPAAVISLAVLVAGCAGIGGASPTGPMGSNPPVVGSLAASPLPAILGPSPSSPSEVTAMPTAAPFTLTSPAFAAGAAIPAEYSCQGADVSPQLTWSGPPAGTAALVLVVDDPDAGDFSHWLVLDLDPSLGGLPRDVSPTAASPQQGRNDFGRVGWGGPCPPSGKHHYQFTLSALAAPLGLAGHPGRAAVDAALASATVLATATLTATYRRT